MTGSSPRQRLSEEERRAQILRATFQVVARHGFEGASTTRIAEQAGVSKGLIWHYFADKVDLMKQALTSTVISIGEEMASDLVGPAPERIRAHLRWMASWARTHRDEYRAMDEIARKLRNGDGELVFTDRDYERIYQAYEEGYRRLQADGTFREFDPRVMAVTYQSAIDSMLSYCYARPDIDADQYADDLADILLAAMQRPT